MEDNMSGPPNSNDRFCIWKHLLNHICVTEALNRPQNPPNMVLYQGNHIASVLSERGLRCGAVYHPLLSCYGKNRKVRILTVSQLTYCPLRIARLTGEKEQVETN